MTDVSEIPPEFAAALEGLKQKYMEKLEQSVPALEEACRKVKDGQAVDLKELRILCHNLAGSGETFGMKDVSDATRVADLFLLGWMDAGKSGDSLSEEERGALVSHLHIALSGIRSALDAAG